MVDGFKAMVNMRVGKLDAVKKVLAGLKYKAKGNTFTLTWKTSVDDIKAAVKQAMEQRKKH